MKDEIWIWNSRARRRRSASDNFEENGLHLLKAYLLEYGISVQIIDDATRDGYNALSPPWLSHWNHLLYKQLFDQEKSKLVKTIIAPLASLTQNILSLIQHRRMILRLDAVARNIAIEKMKLFGIKVWYGEAFTYSKILTKLINKYSPATIVIAGGYHATLYEEDILQYSNFDLSVAGNGEEPLKSIIEFVRSTYINGMTKEDFLNILIKEQQDKPIPGLIFRNNNQIVFNSKNVSRKIKTTIPRYTYNSGKTKVHILLESSGCPWNACNFCVHNKFAPVYHTRKPSDIIYEIKEMIRQGIGLFRFAGSDTPPHYGQQIAKAILEDNLHVEFTMGCRAVKNCKDPEVFRETSEAFALLMKAGLRGIFMGGETGNDMINYEVMNKGITSEDVLYTIKAFRQAQINAEQRATVSLAFIYPSPIVASVKLTDIFQDNIQLIKKAQPDAVMISPPGPFKNTNWYCKADEFGFDISADFIQRMMEYEYVLYKPVDLWKEIPFSLKGMDFKKMLAETQKLRRYVDRELDIPTDLSDEHFLMISSSGMLSGEGIKEFKQKSLLSILSSDYRYLDYISDKVNRYSNKLADSNNL